MADAARRVVLWRHARTDWNSRSRFQGHTDTPIDEVGLAQARRAAPLLAALRPDVLVTSDLTRALATAAELAAVTGLVARPDAGLRESHGGTWQGLTGEEIRARDLEGWLAWRAGADIPAEGAETRAQVAARSHDAVRRALVDVPPGGTLVAVTHGGTARCLMGALAGLPREHWGVFGGLANCSWSVLEERRDDRALFRVVEHNAGALPEPVLGDES